MDVNEVFITCVDIWAKDGFDDRIDKAQSAKTSS